MPLILVPTVTSEMKIAQLANGMHCWPDVAIKIIKKNTTSAFKFKKKINLLILTK